MNRSSRTTELKSRKTKARWAGNVPDRDGEQAIKKMAILRAAAVLFREHGYERTTLNDVAQALNVTKPTLYYYIKNKEDLLVEIKYTAFDEIMEVLNELDRGEQSGADILRGIFVRSANWVTGDFGVCATQHFLITLAPENLAKLRKAHRVVERKIRETIARGIEDGTLRPCEPWIVASAILGSLNWMAFWYEAGPTRKSAAELGKAYFELFIEGLGARDVHPGASRVRVAARASAAASKEPAGEKKPVSAKRRVRKTGGTS